MLIKDLVYKVVNAKLSFIVRTSLVGKFQVAKRPKFLLIFR